MAAQPEIPAVVAHILAGRGLAPEAMAAFVHPSYDEHLHDPFLLTDMEPAVARIIEAAEKHQKVAIYGDYDIDGITASAIMIEGLRALRLHAASYIPDRFEEGYGLNTDALAELKSKGIDLVISVDCGITSVAEAAWAREHGLDLIITDHHAIAPETPEAIAVINPKRDGDAYPFKELCGAGVAFKLIQALQQRAGHPTLGQEKWLLDLVALGTVCDVMPLVGENRVLVTYGLKVLRQTRRVGLRALAAVGGVEVGALSTYHLGFVLGPRLNAAGRLEHAARSLELMLTHDEARAAVIAGELDEPNAQRRRHQAAIVKAATERAAEQAEAPVLLLADEAWSHGIVGIAAAKVAETVGKPAFIAQTMGETTKGSARSLGSYSAVGALQSASDILTRYGGHVYAAGFTVPTAKLGELHDRLVQYYTDSEAHSERPPIVAELDIAELASIDWQLLDELALLEPYGRGNDEPLLALDATVDSIRAIGADGSHLKLSLGDGRGKSLGAIGFGLATRYNDLTPGVRVRAVGSLGRNDFRGESSLQLTLKTLQYEQT